ncbi:MAG: hypothetical protein QM626_12140 [Microbacterium sp.]|uniref:GGIII-like transmembrane region-containing protein n=1 Tax=Microbacterium sp. TaxID=51671 RepID=UPI0039E609CB
MTIASAQTRARAVVAALAAVTLAALSVGGASAALAADVVTATTSDGAGYTGPTTVVVGQTIHLSGTGWLDTAQTTGSVIGVKLDAGAVSTTGTVTNPATGATIGNKTVIAAVQADATGAWSLDLPFPTTASSTATWAAGEAHTINLLTGSLLSGDVVRSGTLTFTIVAASTGASDTVTGDGGATDTGPADPGTTDDADSGDTGTTVTHTGTEYTLASDSSVHWWVPSTVAEGEDIVISGAGWVNTAGTGGSTVAVKLDDGATPKTTLDVVNPFTDTVFANKTVFAIVTADADGEWEMTIPYPTLTSSNQDWSVGETHSITLLSGSLQTPSGTDRVRTTAAQPASFTVVKEPVTEPSWSHTTITQTDATTGSTAVAWVEDDVAAGEGSTIRIAGTGWVDKAGTGASTVAIKLNYGTGAQYTRTGDGVIEALAGSPDPTIWALLAPSNDADAPNVYTIDADGSFEITIDAPAGLTAGQFLTAQFLSGRFGVDDVSRSQTTSFLTVGGVPYTDTGTGTLPTCVPTSDTAAVTIVTPTVEAGGLLHVTGAGWCNPTAASGGSVIAIKLDEGAYSRLDTSVHANQTIWAIIEADDTNGTFDTYVQLPDGTTSGSGGSSPAFGEGAHTLRLLTGSLAAGDQSRTVLSGEFVVGAYAPGGVPDPLDAATLTSATANGVTAVLGTDTLTVTVPGASAGDWLYLMPYAADGSPRYPWLSTWFRAAAGGVVTASLSGVTLPTGDIRIAVLNGNQGETGTLRGWASLHVPEAAATTDGTSTTATTATPAPSVRTIGVSVGSTVAPTTVPASPVASDAELTAANAGSVTGTQDGTIVTILLPYASPGDWVYVYAFSDPTPVGWIAVDTDKLIRVDVAALPAGAHKLAVLDADGALIGWTAVTVAASETATTSSATSDDVADASAEAATTTGTGSGGALSAADWWFIGGGAALAAALVIVVIAVARRRPTEAAR